ncbi:MAG: aldehyde dehydrogenase family protein [Lewinella sp.]|nr:aldehyde dehydrogenase family protein [Lewinella sp.]
MASATLTTDLQQLFERQKAHALQQAQTTADERIERLRRIEQYLNDPTHEADLIEALRKDFRKPAAETLISETGVVFQHLKFARQHLRRWMRPERVATPLVMIGTRNYIHFEPKGVCLIMAPWNYPFNLSILPLIYAIAAGNTVVLKPSEISDHTSAYIRQMISTLFPPEEVAVVEGDVAVATALLDLPFNHIFFTGSPAVGKIVMKAASRHLSSVTLELGGKSPAIIDPSVNLKKAARQTLWGKCLNAGQTCIAPDYLIVHRSLKEDFIEAYRVAVRDFYLTGRETVADSPDFARIISDKHFQRIKGLLDDAVGKGARVEIGGETDAATRYIAPTLLSEVTEEMEIMQEEIFGPVMPLLTYDTAEDIIELINRRPKPLTLYIQSKRRNFIRRIMQNTSAGGTVINDYLLGYGNPNLPFGGVNNSGIGKSLGAHGFREFSNERGVNHRIFGEVSFLFPPYGPRLNTLVNFLFKRF